MYPPSTRGGLIEFSPGRSRLLLLSRARSIKLAFLPGFCGSIYGARDMSNKAERSHLRVSLVKVPPRYGTIIIPAGRGRSGRARLGL
jgi:hypothetical protein